jgi:hypothetical protein
VKPFGVGKVVSLTDPSSGGVRGDGIVQVRLAWGDLYTLQSNVQHLNPSPSSSSSSAAPPSPPPPSSSSSVSSSVSSSSSSSLRVTDPVPLSSIPVVSSICLSAAAVKAKELSLDEERKLLRCVAQLVQAQMRRVELKINHINQLDHYLTTKQHELHQHFTTLYNTTTHSPPPPPQPDSTQPIHHPTDSTTAANHPSAASGTSTSSSSSAMQIST